MTPGLGGLDVSFKGAPGTSESTSLQSTVGTPWTWRKTLLHPFSRQDSNSACYMALSFQTVIPASTIATPRNRRSAGGQQEAGSRNTARAPELESGPPRLFFPPLLPPLSLQLVLQLQFRGAKSPWRQRPWPLEGLLFKSVVPMRLSSLKKQLPPPPLSLNFHCWRIPSQVEN